MCRHRQVTPHSARMLVAVPSVAPSAITGTDSTMVPAARAGLRPAAAHLPRGARCPPPGSSGLRARQQLSRRRRGGEGGRRRGRQRRGPDASWLVHPQYHVNDTPPRQHVTRPPNPIGARAFQVAGTLGLSQAVLHALCMKTLVPKKGRRSQCISGQTRAQTQACGFFWGEVILPGYQPFVHPLWPRSL